MTEQTATSAPQTSAVTDNGEIVKLDPFEQTFANKLTADINERNTKVSTLAAIGGNPEALLESLKVSSDNPDVVQLRDDISNLTEAIAKANDKLVAILKPEVERIRNESADQIKTLEDAIAEADKAIKGAMSFLKDSPNVLKVLPKLVSVNKATRQASGKSDGRRIRGYLVSVDGTLVTMPNPNKPGETISNLSAAALKLNVDTTSLQSLFFAAVGGIDVQPKDFPQSVNLKVKVNDTEHTINMVKKEKTAK